MSESPHVGVPSTTGRESYDHGSSGARPSFAPEESLGSGAVNVPTSQRAIYDSTTDEPFGGWVSVNPRAGHSDEEFASGEEFPSGSGWEQT